MEAKTKDLWVFIETNEDGSFPEESRSGTPQSRPHPC